MVQVGVIMGSISDWDTMEHTCQTLAELGINFEKEVISAHRTPDDMFEYAETARERGLKVIIAGAGGAAHLPGRSEERRVGEEGGWGVGPGEEETEGRDRKSHG